MSKFNYVKARKLYEKYFNLVCDPWCATDDEVREDKRFFMKSVTRKDTEGLQPYIDYIKEEKHYVCEPYPNAKSKVWDFDMMREYDALIDEIVNFEN